MTYIQSPEVTINVLRQLLKKERELTAALTEELNHYKESFDITAVVVSKEKLTNG